MKKIYGDIKKLFNELKGQDTEGEIDPEIGDCIPDPKMCIRDRAIIRRGDVGGGM